MMAVSDRLITLHTTPVNKESVQQLASLPLETIEG